MNGLKLGLWVSVCLFARLGFAIFATDTASEEIVQARGYKEPSAGSAESAKRKQEEIQESARARVEKVRNLPPDQIQAWTEGKITDDELNRLSVAPGAAADAVAVAVAVPRSHVIRLEICGALVVVLAGVLWYRRRQEQAAVVTGGKRRG